MGARWWGLAEGALLRFGNAALRCSGDTAYAGGGWIDMRCPRTVNIVGTAARGSCGFPGDDLCAIYEKAKANRNLMTADECKAFAALPTPPA